MLRRREGFTVPELVVVLLIMSVVTSFTFKSMAAVQSRYASRAARDVFAGLVAQTRSHAIERGIATWMLASAPGDSAVVWDAGGWNTVVHFDEEFDVDLRLPSADIVLVMTPRGYATPTLTNFSTIQKVGFQNGTGADSLMLYPLGQVRY